MPVPHGFVAPLLAAHQAGILTWRWISTNVVTPILADPLQAQALALFLAHIGVASTDRAAHFPDTELIYNGIYNNPRVSAAALPRARRYLAGLVQPAGLQAQLTHYANQTNAVTQQMLTAQAAAQQATAPVTLDTKNPLVSSVN